MSLDKLVDLLSTSELHFTPLASFAKSDPFEGFLPAVALQADAALLRPFVQNVERAFELTKEQRKKAGLRLTDEETAVIQRNLEALRRDPGLYHVSMAKADLLPKIRT